MAIGAPPAVTTCGSAKGDRRAGAVAGRAVLALAATAVVTIPFGWAAMFNQFTFWQDEGYLLVTLREWARHGGLYTRVFSRYGPAEMFFFGLPEHLLGSQFTFTSGRVVTLTLWIATSMVLGLIVLVIGRHTVTAILTQVVSFFLLESFTNEPMHPGQLVALVMALMVWVMAAVRPKRPVLGDAMMGIFMGTLLMTEINLGVFGLMALAYFFSIGTTLSIQPVLRFLSEVALVALGPILIILGPATTSGSTDWWAVKYAVVYATAAIVVVLLTRLRRVEPIPTFDAAALIRFAGWYFGSIVFFAGFIVVTGTRLRDLIDGVFLAPLGQSKSLITSADIDNTALLWLSAPVVVLVAYRWLQRLTDPDGPQLGNVGTGISAGIRIIAGIVAIVAISRETYSALAFIPVIGLCLLPPNSAPHDATSMNARRFLAALALTESLHAFPVAGSQVSWSLMLVVPAAVLAVQDGFRELAQLRPLRMLRNLNLPMAGFLLGLILIPWPSSAAGVYGSYVSQARTMIDAYRSGEPLRLPGSSAVRLPAEEVNQLRGISAALRRTSAQFVSVPGYDALYILAGIAPPNGINGTVWMYLFNQMQQQSVVNVLEHTKGPVCLVERSGQAIDVVGTIPPLTGAAVDWRTWNWAQPIPPGPLVEYLSHGFVPRVSVPPYLILVRAK